jgi:calcium permeable stress-gated cation channel
MAGAVTKQEVELKTQIWYFAFQVIQVFLVTTFSSGASAVTTQIIQYPASAPLVLAQNLPKASNFYISYFVLHGLASASGMLFNAQGILMFGVGRIMHKTPRKQYEQYINMSALEWGSVYPVWTNLGVIGEPFPLLSPMRDFS